MGAGIVKPEPNGGIRIHIHTGGSQHVHTAENHTANSTSSFTSSNRRQSPTSNCEDCATSFSTFKRKKSCKDCGRDFCSQCVLQPSRRPSSASSRDYQCKSCQILLTGTFSRSQLLKWKIKDLKALLTKQNINTSKCKEKSDLIDLLFTNYGNTPNLYRRGTEQEILVQQMTERMRQEQSNSTPRQPPKVPRNPSTPQPAGETQSSGAAGETQSSGAAGETHSSGAGSQSRQQDEAHSSGADNENRLENEEESNNNQDSEGVDERKVSQDSQPMNARIQLDDVKSEEEIDSLDIRSLKRLLLNNFVDYKGCKEKWELQERLRRLWRDNQANKKLYEEQTATSEATSSTTAQPGSREEDICKICMDAAIDCVLLECGHMVSCTKCGKQLSECPICRQYVVRAVHTFRT